MFPAAKDFLNQALPFISSIIEEATMVGVDLSKFPMDHFCLRVETAEQYQFYKQDFKSLGVLLSEAKVNGRPISTFKLHTPLVVGAKTIPCIEIPSPKEGAPYSLGLEHVECVIEEALPRFVQRFPLLKFNCRAINQPINPEVALKLPSGKSVKFHNQTLESVIELEKKLGFSF